MNYNYYRQNKGEFECSTDDTSTLSLNFYDFGKFVTSGEGGDWKLLFNSKITPTKCSICSLPVNPTQLFHAFQCKLIDVLCVLEVSGLITELRTTFREGRHFLFVPKLESDG